MENYGRAEKIVNAATAAGIGTILTGALPTPEWEGHAPVNVDRFANFMAEMARRNKGKGPGGSNPDMELPNELNGRVSAEVYVQLACASYPRIKAVDPTIKVLGGSQNMYTKKEDPLVWFKGLYDNGIKDCIDAVSFHNYSGPSKDPSNNFARFFGVMKEHGDGDKPVMLTEFGASTCPGEKKPDGCYTEQGQADKIEKYIKWVDEDYPQVTDVYVYADADIPSRAESNPHEAYFGIYATDAAGLITREKPAVETLRQLYGK